ncbi:MAG: chromosome segregation protein SMC [Ruminococcaceae bacterium]|nr:chromosome segregation protein SMC [Oscillospiraceae bacterium]
MLLSSIEIQGFKSFADKTVLKFGKGITAVVGPNGSGKSNISDAVRWVLGEQSTKSLRGQSMEDVIFGGTETRRPHGFCEVTLNINNADRTLNFDNDFVSITRRFYRSHESEYAINGVSVRLKDIHELFMDTGLGRDGYSMIGQGKIDNIISSKSGERRDIFEEASGISKYRYRKIEAERKLTAAEDNLLRLHDILDELKSRVGPLEEQSKKAEKFLELAEAKKELEIGLWLYTLNNSKEALRNQESKIAASQLSYKQIEESLEEFDRKTEQNTAFFAKLTSDIEGERLNISSINEEIVRLGGEISVIENSIKFNTETKQRLLEEKENLNKSDKDALIEIENKTALIEEKISEKTKLEGDLRALEEKLSQLLSDSDSISRKIEAQIRSLNTISAQSADMRVAMVTADTSIDEITLRINNAAELKTQYNEEISNLNNEFKENEELLGKIEETLESYQNSLKGFELRLASKAQAADSLKSELDSINLDIEAKKRRVQILKELEANMEGFGNSVKSVMSQAELGTLKGICGPVSKLIKVEKQYSIAVETALGSAIQNIITETENDAKRAINYLKTSNKGRATFLPVSTIIAREFKEHGFEDMFGFIGLASDLVECDKKYKEIVKYLLGGAIVAEDIDCATTIAKKFGYRIKVVTLDGQVINPGGSLTGGSLIKNAGLLSRASDIKRMEEEIVACEKKMQEISKKFADANDAVLAVDADITATKAEIITFNEDKIRALAELKRIDDLRNGVNSSLSQLNEEIAISEEKIAALKKQSVEAALKIAEFDTQKSALQTEIDSMTGGRDSLNDTREALTNDITATKLMLIEINKDIEQINAASALLSDLISDRTKRSEEIDNEIIAVDANNSALNEKIVLTNENIEQLKVKITESESNINTMLEKRNETEKSGVELRNSEREKTMLREKIGGELARLTERKEIMLKEYDEVIRRLYDEYSLTRTEAEKIAKEPENPNEAKKLLAELKGKIRSLGNVNVAAIEEYKEVKERYDFLNAQVDDVEKTRAELYKLINQLTTQMREIFTEGFAKINQNFSKTFTELFGGGEASLTLSDPENILESGIDINVKLPGKSVPSLDGLSGGEKALIALSIYFAIMRVNAPPFCFLDEVDTALDDINVERFADYMKKPDFSTQFICVTHRRGTMEAADMLYGVTMQEKGITKLLELNVSELEKKLLEANQGA